MRVRLLLIPVFLIILLNLTSGIKSECSKDKKAINLIINEGHTISNWETCYDGECVIYKEKAYCLHKHKFEAKCTDDISIVPTKIKEGWIKLYKKCKSGCDSGGCLVCCQKKLFKFGRNCYESNTEKGCGFFTKKTEDSCSNIKSCIASGKPKTIKLELRDNEITIPLKLVQNNKMGIPEKVIFTFNDGTNEIQLNAKSKEGYYYINTNNLEAKKYDAQIYVLYKGKDYHLMYVSSINLEDSLFTQVCINCKSIYLKDEKSSTFSRCGIFFKSIQKELQGTNVDPWLILGLVAQESSCRYEENGGAFQVKAYKDHLGYNPSRNRECEKYVDSDAVPKECQDFVDKIKFQVKTGVQHFLTDYSRLDIKDPITKFAIIGLSYNRGWSTVEPTLKYLKDYDLYTALKKGCKEIYDGSAKDRPIYDKHGNDMCTYKKGYGACYATATIKKLKIIAKECQGHLNPAYERLEFPECAI